MKFFEAMSRYQALSGEISELEQAKTILETTPGPGMSIAIQVIDEAVNDRVIYFDNFGRMEVIMPGEFSSDKIVKAEAELPPEELPQCCGENCCPEAEEEVDEAVEMKLPDPYLECK